MLLSYGAACLAPVDMAWPGVISAVQTLWRRAVDERQFLLTVDVRAVGGAESAHGPSYGPHTAWTAASRTAI